jgi:phosphate transport system substrate-binding protein
VTSPARIFLVAMLSLVGWSAANAQSPANPQSDNCKPQTSRVVSGRLTDAVSSKPLRGIKVSVFTADGQAAGKLRPCITGTNGIYQLELSDDLNNIYLVAVAVDGSYWPADVDLPTFSFPLHLPDTKMRDGHTPLSRQELSAVLKIQNRLRSSDPEIAAKLSTALEKEPIAAVQLAELRPAASTISLHTAWLDGYSSAANGTKIRYSDVGSGAGIAQVSSGQQDVGFSNVRLTNEQLQTSNGTIAQVPVGVDAVLLVYNLPSISAPVRLDAETISKIYEGKITHWNDPTLKKLNPEIPLPAQSILVVGRSDSAGETSMFSRFLSYSSSTWSSVHTTNGGSAVDWPVGIRAKGNEGVMGAVRMQPGAIGYVSFSSARGKELSVASIRNQAGVFVAPSVASIQAFSNSGGAQLTSGGDSSIQSAEAYPITGFTWVIFKQSQNPDLKKRVDFVQWVLTSGQKSQTELGYVPLTRRVQQQAVETVRKIPQDNPQ